MRKPYQFILALALTCFHPLVQSQDFTASRIERLIPGLISQEKAAGVGIALIRQGAEVWSGYFGEQGPGIPLTTDTLFNTASVAKTIAAETMIALAASGIVNLDEPIYSYVEHTDLSADNRYSRLTPRMLLSHRAGLLNWESSYPDGRLAFDHDPDTKFSYSGAGIELAINYAQRKSNANYAQLVQDHIFDKISITEIALGQVPLWAEERLATPMDSNGVYQDYRVLNPNLSGGSTDVMGVSDDLLTTVSDYSQFLQALISSQEFNTPLRKNLRESIVTSFEGDPIYNCSASTTTHCPLAYGHSIGWQVFDYGDHKVISHSGSDAGENALVYFSPELRHGAVIFVNGANGWVIMARVLELLGDEPKLAEYYRGLILLNMERDLAPLR